MSENSGPITLALTLLFGVLVGGMGIIGAAYASGFIDWDASGTARSGALSATPGMDALNAYECRKGETKHIILGGIEDRYSPSGNETIAESTFGRNRVIKLEQADVQFRDYDERGMDKILSDEFLIPSKTMHGIVALRMENLSSLKNDSFALGQFDMGDSGDRAYGLNVDLLGVDENWNMIGDLGIANISDLDFYRRPNTEPTSHLLDFIQSGMEETRVEFRATDDTVVDFIGFAVCEAPRVNKGATYTLGEYPLEPGYVSATCETIAQVYQCGIYTGDTLCEAERPVMCFRDDLSPPPESVLSHPRSGYWSGGAVKLTAPVRGDKFKTADDVTTYCRAEFGPDWRVASLHDGAAAGGIFAKGREARGTRAWIETKGLPYASCWAPRPDYPARQAEKQ